MSRFERIVVPSPVQPPCPAASLVAEAEGGTGCICRITTNVIASQQNPSTLASYCFNSEGYRTCPTWRADREEFWRSKTIRDLLNRKGDRVAGHPEDRQRDQGLALALEAQELDQWQSQRERES